MMASIKSSDDVLVDFLLHDGRSEHGWNFNDVMQWSESALEYNHTYIQWLFPLDAPSIAVKSSPFLNHDDFKLLSQSKKVQGRTSRAFYLFLGFLGLNYRNGQVLKKANFDMRSKVWLTPKNHNYMRISRVLKNLTLMKREDEARAFADFLTSMNESKDVVDDETLHYWRLAIAT
jgi:hypothetical protein